MTKMILIVEDDLDIVNLIKLHLADEDYTLLTTQNGQKGLDLAMEQLPDLIVLDLMLPGSDGLDICERLKNNPKTENIPIVMLTAKGEVADRIVGLESGADDYIGKPFDPRELLLRIRAVLRRYGNEKPEETQIQYQDLKIDFDSHKVWIKEKKIPLTITEFNLLSELIRNMGRVLTRDQLLDRVWGYQFDGYARTVDTHIRRLRQKMGEYKNFIETFRGVGYGFKES